MIKQIFHALFCLILKLFTLGNIILKQKPVILNVRTEAAVQGCYVKKVFLKILQNSQENTCTRVFFLIKLQALGMQIYEKRDSDTGVFL